MQLSLMLLDRLRAVALVWETLEDGHRAVVVDLLARLLVKAIVAQRVDGGAHDE